MFCGQRVGDFSDPSRFYEGFIGFCKVLLWPMRILLDFSKISFVFTRRDSMMVLLDSIRFHGVLWGSIGFYNDFFVFLAIIGHNRK